MKNLLVSSIIAVSSLVSFSSAAAGPTEEFFVNSLGMHVVQGKTKSNVDVWAYAGTSGNSVQASFVAVDASCVGFSNFAYDADSMYINSTKVSMKSQCFDGGLKIYFPKTRSGKAYVNNQFSNGSQVLLEQSGLSWVFSAKGYRWAESEVSSTIGGL